MKKATYFIKALILIVTISSCSPEEQIDNTTFNNIENSSLELNDIENEVLEKINNHRVSIGLNVLKINNEIKTQTENHTIYMINEDKPSHDYFYSRKEYLISHAKAIKVSENVAYGFTSAESVVNSWIKSTEHAQNIEGDHTHFNISAKKSTKGKWYFTNIFIKK